MTRLRPPINTSPQRLRTYRRVRDYFRQRRYPIWSSKAIGALSLVAVIVSTALVFLIGRRSLFIETEITLGIIAASLFVFLAYGLYTGARIKKEHLDLRAANIGDGIDLLDALPDTIDMELPDVGFDFDADEGCLGAILGIIVSIIVFVAVVLLGWVLLNVFWGVFIVLLVAVFWIFNRALRQVFTRSRRCRGNLSVSLGYSALYTGWLLGLVWVIQWFATS